MIIKERALRQYIRGLLLTEARLLTELRDYINPKFADYTSSDYFVAPIDKQGFVIALPFEGEGLTPRRLKAITKFHPASVHNSYDLSPQSIKQLEDLVSKGVAQKRERSIEHYLKDHTLDYRNPEPGSDAESWSSEDDVPDSYIEYHIPGPRSGMGVRVNHDKGEIDMDLSFLKYMSRRGGGKPNSDPNRQPPSYVIPSGDPTEGTEQEVKKLLNHIQQRDTRDILDYPIVGNEKYYGMKVRDVLSRGGASEIQRALDPSATGVVAYHGTTSTLVKNILERGLRPGKSQYSYSDQVKGWSEGNIYLTLSPANAENYATRAAIWYGGTPTVLRVTIPDPAHIVADEDVWGWLTLDPPVKIKRQGSDEPDEVEEIHIKNWYRAKERGFYDHADPEQIAAVEAQIAKAMPGLIKKGMKSNDAVFAYRGPIMPKFIEKWRQYPKKSYGPESKLDQEKYDRIRREVQAKMKRLDQK